MLHTLSTWIWYAVAVLMLVDAVAYTFSTLGWKTISPYSTVFLRSETATYRERSQAAASYLLPAPWAISA